jgi:hypothetical protein
MNHDFSWIAPLKEGVLVLYFITFTAILAWVFGGRSQEHLEQLGHLPLEDEEVR